MNTEKIQFRRELGIFDGVSLVAGAMIGSGIFYIGAIVLERTGMNPAMALACWLVGGLVSLFGGLCFAELGSAMPRSGGYIVYLDTAFHPVVGFMAGFTDFFIGGPGSSAAIAIALMTAIAPVAGLDSFAIKAGAIALVAIITIYNLLGVKLVAQILKIALVAKLLPIVIIIAAAIVFSEHDGFLANTLTETAAGARANGLLENAGMMAFAIVATLWAYEGWMNLNIVTEEMKNPQRNLPLTLLVAIGGVTALYVLFNYAVLSILPGGSVATQIANGDPYLGTSAANMVFGKTGETIVLATMVMAMFGALNGFMLAGPRLCHALARDGHFFAIFARLHPRYQVPHAAIVLQGIIASGLVLSSQLEQLTEMVVVSMMAFKLLAILAVPVLRKKYPDIERPYRVPFYPVSVILTAAVFAALFIHAVVSDFIIGMIGICVPACGAITWLAFDICRKR